MKQLLRMLEEERKKIWTVNKPKDIDRMRTRLGAKGQNYTINAYSVGDTNGICDFLHSMRITAKDETTDIKTLISATCNLLSFEGSRFARYYKLEDTTKLIEKTVDVLKKDVKTNKEFLEVIEALMSYLGKINYWLDLEMPWKELADEYEKLKEN